MLAMTMKSPKNIPEIHKCKEIGRTCACYKVMKAARAVSKFYDEAFRPIGLRATQCSLLVAARILGPVTVVKLALAAVMGRTTLTRNLQVLAKRGLISISTGEDRREKVVALTAAGEEILAEAITLWEEAQNRIRQGLGEERMRGLLEDLAAVISLTREE